MGDDLTISGGGSTAVATDELFAAAQSLHRLALEAAALRLELGYIDALVSMNWLTATRAPAAAARAEFDIDQAKIVMGEIEVSSRAIGWALSSAAEGYGFIERFIGGMGMQLAGDGAALAGSVVSASAIASPLAAIGARIAARGLVDAHVFEGDPARAASGRHPDNRLLSNPATAGAVRMAAMSVDDGMMTASGIPYPVARLLGDGGLGIAGIGLASTALLGAGASVGLLTETPVRQVAEQSRPVAGPPAGFADRLARVPIAGDGPQVVVEHYAMPEGPDEYAVYVTGTVTFSPEATTEPWDMTSNIANTAGPGAGSYDAVVQAMRAAGVDGASPVQLVGYSQGGATAARIAASGDFSVVGLTTFGGPTGQIPIPASIPTVIVEHSDDIVPALGGVQVNQQAVIVERDVFAGRDIPADYAVPAHHLEYYEETARLMDVARSDQIAGAAARLDALGRGATSITSTAYTFERVEPGDPAASGGR
ncbi:hypothetical protein BH11ACT4_BH11ACT4_09910 [soil metagenome]